MLNLGVELVIIKEPIFKDFILFKQTFYQMLIVEKLEQK
jgi:hypothetical protein